MWTWSLNWGEITPKIVSGTCPMEPDDLRRIREGAGVSAVFSLQHDDCHAYGLNESGAHASADADWQRAQADVLHNVLVNHRAAA